MPYRIGTSGWSYDHWKGVLYRPGLPVGERLPRYVEEFDTVELNASFYRWPGAARFRSWHDRLPAGFAMFVKAPRGLTHAKRLYEPETWTERIADGWRALGDRQAGLLVQLPPSMARDDARLDHFLGALPKGLRVAIEMRHPSWNDEDVFGVLERHGAAYVVMSGAGLDCVLRATADFVYIRLHGPSDDHLYAGSYSDDDLAWWADRLREWDAQGREVFAYFNNDGEGHAVRNAWTLRSMLGLGR